MKLQVGKARVAIGSAFIGVVVINIAILVTVIWGGYHFIHKFW
jgi:hypothetical protein